jgi:hypothetical protein
MSLRIFAPKDEQDWLFLIGVTDLAVTLVVTSWCRSHGHGTAVGGAIEA